jgi:hypothetical protein
MLANVTRLILLILPILPLAGCGQAAVDPAARYKWRDHRQVGIVLPPGSQLSVDAEGSTDKKAIVAGLTFTTNCDVEFGEDGTLLIDKEGIVTTDPNGSEWVSQKVQLDGKEIIAFFPTR